jgi:DNA-binding transcriptional ArsR family regulator
MRREEIDREAFRNKAVGELLGVFRQLSDTTRMRILVLLSKGPRNVTSLVEALEMPQPSVSSHLGVLRAGNLVRARPSGREMFYELSGRVTSAARRGFRIELGHGELRIARRR